MKKNILRVLGVLFSAVIIGGIFLPYIKDPSSSLFELYKSNNQIVLPIVLIVFAVVSILLYILGKRVEFALSTGGAVLFYMITEIVSLLKEDALNQISIGFILIGVGAILLIINTIITIIVSKKSSSAIETPEPEPSYQPNDMIQTLDAPNTIEEPVQPQPVVEPVQPVIQEPIVEPVAPVQPIVEPVAPVQPIVEPVTPVQPIVEPVAPVQPIVEPVTPVQPIVEPVAPVQPIVEPVAPVQPIVEPVAPVQSIVEPVQPINELKPIEDINPQGLKPIEEPVLVQPAQFNPLPDIQFEPINEPVQEIKPIHPVEKEAPLNPVLQQFEIPTSFLNSGKPTVSDEPQSINTESQPSVGMDIFNNH